LLLIYNFAIPIYGLEDGFSPFQRYSDAAGSGGDN
jgi:hypothetical protein